jgi:hypothetical protein
VESEFAAMSVANRATDAPVNIWNDHSDSMSRRDAGWLQLFAEDQRSVQAGAGALEHADLRAPRLPGLRRALITGRAGCPGALGGRPARHGGQSPIL